SSDPTRLVYLNVPRTSLLFPDSSVPFVNLSRINTSVNTVSNTLAFYVMDTMKLGRYFELIGGFRWDRFDTSYKQTVSPGAVNLSRVDEMPSGRAAVVFKPAANGSLYFAW